MNLYEGNYRGDLQRLIDPELHIDEYRSKMGNDDDIVVMSFKVKGKEPAMDLVSFLETGYDYILDADVSPGEIAPGWFLVFVELSRRTTAPDQIWQIVEEALNLTLQTIDEWCMTYGKADEHGSVVRHKKYALTKENLNRFIPISPKQYRDLHDDDDNFESSIDDSSGDDDEIAALKMAADLPVNQTAPSDPDMNDIKQAAGIM